jgi:chromosome segregation and condensation protein ScpB
VSDTFSPGRNHDRTLEEVVGAQALEVDLREAVMACISGEESRRWKVQELVERFKNLAIAASNGTVTRALAELEVELELSAWAPWRLIERGAEWILVPKSELLAVLSGTRKLPVKADLTETHKAVLLVAIGHRRKGGVSKTRIGEILKLDPSPYLDDLEGQDLIYADPTREFQFWRPTPGALLALGLRSIADIPALKELEEWFDALNRRNASGSELDSFFAKSEKLESRRLKRDLERRETVGTSTRPGALTQRITQQESGSDLLRSEPATGPLPHPVPDSPQSIV